MKFKKKKIYQLELNKIELDYLKSLAYTTHRVKEANNKYNENLLKFAETIEELEE